MKLPCAAALSAAALLALVPTAPVWAQVTEASPFGTEIHDDRSYLHAWFDQLEGRLGGGNDQFRWDGQAWYGNDAHKLWLKSEGRLNEGGRERMSDGDHEVLYAQPFSRYFDWQAGVRLDLDSGPTRTWIAFGVQGLAPNWFNVAPTIYLRDNGYAAFRLNASYDQRLTQRLVLQPQVELNAYSKTDRERGVGSGLSDIDTGLRLRYEITRELAPYVGITYRRRFSGTANLAREEGQGASALRFVAGLRVWF